MTISAKRNPAILCFVSAYLPGYRSGGPLRSIANFVEHFGDEFDIFIVCGDRDLTDKSAYPFVKADQWTSVGKARVFYASPKKATLLGFARLISDTPHDVLYLNSFFCFRFTIIPLLARRLGLAPESPCVIAPRGEFSEGAIKIKLFKKKIYIFLSRIFNIYNELRWQSSSELESEDIFRELGVKRELVVVAPNLPPVFATLGLICKENYTRSPGPLRIIFLSRISVKKNLDYLLRTLKNFDSPIQLGIFGTIENHGYWNLCRTLMGELPPFIDVFYGGGVQPDDVYNVLASYDLLVLPTRGENYGHVIFESLTAGTPVLISDKTPWKGDDFGAITTLSLANSMDWLSEISDWSRMDIDSLLDRRVAARRVAMRISKNDEILDSNRRLFLSALKIHA